MTAQVFSPSVQTTFLPKANLLKTFASRFAERSSKGRIYRHNGTTSVTVVSN